MKLTPKQRAFCEQYSIDKDATAAAIRAGYSRKTAYQIGFENLQKPAVRKYVDKLLEEAAAKAGLKAEDVINELRKLSFYNMRSFVDGNNQIKSLHDLPEELTAAVISIRNTYTRKGMQVELKLADKKGALESLGRHLGIFEKDNEQSAIKIKVSRK